MYETVNAARDRLSDTVIYNPRGEPFRAEAFTEDPNGGLRVMGTDLVVKRVAEYALNECQFMQYNLGYMNTPSGAVYVYRIPVRKYRQGLHFENVNIGAYMNWRDTITKPYFIDMMMRKYPSLREAQDSLQANKECESVAFHPRMALSRDDLGLYFLLYKGKRIGWSDTDEFRLPSDFSYLRESLNESGVKVC